MWGRLERDRPDLIVEVTDEFLRGLGHSASEMCFALVSLGYRMYVIDHLGLHPVSPADDLPSGQFNALFSSRPTLPPPLAVLGPMPANGGGNA